MVLNTTNTVLQLKDLGDFIGIFRLKERKPGTSE